MTMCFVPWVYFSTFLCALWCFSHPITIGVPAGTAVVVICIGQSSIANPGQFTNIILTAGIGVVIIIATRVATEFSTRHIALTRQLALANQRNEVASTIHDLLGHSLTAITVKAQLAQRLLKSDPKRAEDELDDILAIARTSLAEVHTTVTGLRSPSLTEQLDTARRTILAAGIKPILPSEEDIPHYRNDIDSLLGWAIREGVTNAVRHSGATEISVTLTPTCASVTDNGCGLRHSGFGMGLTGLARRAKDAGATLTLTDAHPGTRLSVTLHAKQNPPQRLTRNTDRNGTDTNDCDGIHQ